MACVELHSEVMGRKRESTCAGLGFFYWGLAWDA